MHDSLMNFLRQNTTEEEVYTKRILEIGSFAVTGTPRDIFHPFKPSMYLGIDEAYGPGVDIQMSGYHLYSIFLPKSFDIIICTEVLEHAKDWKQLIGQIKYALRTNGLLYFSCRAPGFHYHDYPGDYWRFTLEQISFIFSDFKQLSLESDSQFPGVFLKAQKTNVTAHPLTLEQVMPLEVYEGYCCSSL